MQPDRVVPERDHDRARERRQIDDRGRLVAPRVDERVGQDQPTLGVGVDDLDGLAEVRLDDVARLDRLAGGQVLGGRDQRRPR